MNSALKCPQDCFQGCTQGGPQVFPQVSPQVPPPVTPNMNMADITIAKNKQYQKYKVTN